MRNLNYKLIVSDFDGTLASHDGTVSPKNRKAIEEYVNEGGIFAISSGRLPASILPLARNLGLKGFVCCCNGAIILEIESGEVVFDSRLSLKTTVTACQKMEEIGLHILAFDLWDYFSNKNGSLLDIYENAAKTKAKLVENIKLSDFLQERKMAAYKLIALVDPKDNQMIFDKLKEANLTECDVTKSMDFIVEVVNNTHSKGTSVAFLADKYGIPMEKTIAVGDNCNDITMIERAGLGIAVSNADGMLKNRADYVCEYANEQSAVARVIEKFGLFHN